MKVFIYTYIIEVSGRRKPYLADQDVPASMLELPNDACLCRIAGTPAQIATILADAAITEQTDEQAEKQAKAKWISDISRLTAEKFLAFMDDLACSDSDRELIQTLIDGYIEITFGDALTKVDEIPTLLDDIGHFVDLEKLDIADPEIDAIAESLGLDPHSRADIQTASRGKQYLQDQENYLLAMIATKKGKSKQFWDAEAKKSGMKGIDIENAILDGKGAAQEFILSRLR